MLAGKIQKCEQFLDAHFACANRGRRVRAHRAHRPDRQLLDRQGSRGADQDRGGEHRPRGQRPGAGTGAPGPANSAPRAPRERPRSATSPPAEGGVVPTPRNRHGPSPVRLNRGCRQRQHGDQHHDQVATLCNHPAAGVLPSAAGLRSAAIDSQVSYLSAI